MSSCANEYKLWFRNMKINLRKLEWDFRRMSKKFHIDGSPKFYTWRDRSEIVRQFDDLWQLMVGYKVQLKNGNTHELNALQDVIRTQFKELIDYGNNVDNMEETSVGIVRKTLDVLLGGDGA